MLTWRMPRSAARLSAMGDRRCEGSKWGAGGSREQGAGSREQGTGNREPGTLYFPAMKVLVLGDSDSAGRFMTGKTWPELVEAGLAATSEREAKVVMEPFSALSPSAHEYAERKVAEHAPDAVVLLLGSFGFTATFTWLRVQQLFGKRAGRWYRRIEVRFDAGTRTEAGAPGRRNRFARLAVRKLIGAKAFSTREKVTGNYREVFRTLARSEDRAIIVFAYPGIGRHAREGTGPAERKKFFGDLRPLAEEYHFGWIDGVAVFAGFALDALKLDELHFNETGHAVIAAAVEAELLRTVAPRQ